MLSAGAYRLLVYETPYWTFPPLPLPSHRLLAAFVLLTVAFVVLCGIVLWYMQQRYAPRDDLLLESSNGSSERDEEELQEQVQPSLSHNTTKGGEL